ncbi:MAG: hypothetical protein ABFC77_13735 [Thermoguttaceae bacterium]
MWRSWKSGRWIILAVAVCALPAGCQSGVSSGIDPSGHYILTDPLTDPYGKPESAPPVDAQGPAEGELPWDDIAVQLHPRETVAPVNSEVVLIAGVCGTDNHLRTNRRLEWSIDPGSVGQFVAVGENGLVDWLLGDFNRPRKVSNTFAIGSTSRSTIRLNRSNCNPDADTQVLRGEGWVSLTSPVEGVSHVTVFAPEVYRWDSRLQAATIHWVDAQWRFPPPAIHPAGTKHGLTTTVMRLSNQAPCERWLVRYEVVEGPPAGFSPSGATSIEAPVDSTGSANVEIFQKQPTPGTNKIAIQVIRPGDLPGANGCRLVVGSGSTLETWAGPGAAIGPSTSSIASPGATSSLEVNVSGPSQAGVGDRVTFEIAIRNLGAATLKGLVVKDRLDPGLEHQAANAQNVIENRTLGDLAPGASRRIRLSIRVTRPGRLCQTVEVSGPGVATASKQACVTVAGGGSASPGGETPTVGAPLGVKISCENKQLMVGETAKFSIELVNNGTTPLRNIRVVDQYDAAFAPTLATDGYRLENGALAWTIDTLPPGRPTQLGVHCTCQKTSLRACSRIRATAPGGVPVEDEACLEIRDAGPRPSTSPPFGPPPTSPSEKTDKRAEPESTDGLTLTVTGLRPLVTAGKELTYEIRVTNKAASPLRQVSVTAIVPEGMTLSPLGTTGPGQTKFNVDGATVRFDPVSTMSPGESLTFLVRVQTKRPGQFRFRASAGAPALPKSVEREASTEVF